MDKVVLASACLCGITCRWHGKKSSKSKSIRALEADGLEVIPVCPEMLGGLPCPRPPVKSRKGQVFETDPETRSVFGREVTAAFQEGANAVVKMALKKNIRTAFMFFKSPSCATSGIAGKALRAAGIEVIPIW